MFLSNASSTQTLGQSVRAYQTHQKNLEDTAKFYHLLANKGPGALLVLELDQYRDLRGVVFDGTGELLQDLEAHENAGAPDNSSMGWDERMHYLAGAAEEAGVTYRLVPGGVLFTTHPDEQPMSLEEAERRLGEINEVNARVAAAERKAGWSTTP